MATFLPRLLERLNAPIVSSRLDSDDIAYLSKFESEISDSDNVSNLNSDDTIPIDNNGNVYQTYLSSFNSHIVDQEPNYSVPVKYTNKIIRNESGLSYRRTTSSISGPLVDYIQKSHTESQTSLEVDNHNSSPDVITGTTASSGSDTFNKPPSPIINPVNVNNNIKNPENQTDSEKVIWQPGFTRQLGTKGRRVLLDLIRKVYRSNPEYYKRVLENKTPPASISNLPFCNIITLWEFANDFGVFDQAMLIHYTHTKTGYPSNFNASPNKARKVTPRVKKVKYVEYDYDPYDEQYEDEYISSYSNSKTSRGRKITQPRRYGDYDQVADINYKIPTKFQYEYSYDTHDDANSYYYKNENHEYVSLDELKGHKIENLTSPLIF